MRKGLNEKINTERTKDMRKQASTEPCIVLQCNIHIHEWKIWVKLHYEGPRKSNRSPNLEK